MISISIWCGLLDKLLFSKSELINYNSFKSFSLDVINKAYYSEIPLKTFTLKSFLSRS